MIFLTEEDHGHSSVCKIKKRSKNHKAFNERFSLHEDLLLIIII